MRWRCRFFSLLSIVEWQSRWYTRVAWINAPNSYFHQIICDNHCTHDNMPFPQVFQPAQSCVCVCVCHPHLTQQKKRIIRWMHILPFEITMIHLYNTHFLRIWMSFVVSHSKHVLHNYVCADEKWFEFQPFEYTQHLTTVWTGVFRNSKNSNEKVQASCEGLHFLYSFLCFSVVRLTSCVHASHINMNKNSANW